MIAIASGHSGGRRATILLSWEREARRLIAEIAMPLIALACALRTAAAISPYRPALA